MRIFKMNGMQITSRSRFMTYFSPVDFLRQPELAAGFACHQLRPLSQWNIYNAEVLYCAVFRWKYPFANGGEGYLSYFAVNDASGNGLPGGGRRLLPMEKEDPENMELLQKVWELAEKTGLPEETRQRLFFLLSAGCFLAEKTAAELTVQPEELRAIYEDKQEEPAAEAWLRFGDEPVVALHARKEPYRILMDSRKTLAQEEQLQLKKIEALPHVQGHAVQMPVILALYRRKEDKMPYETVCIPPKDYRYCTFVGDQPVEILDVVTENGNCRMEREGDIIAVYVEGQQKESISCEGREIVGFAPEMNGGGWIIVEPQNVDYSRYSYYQMYRKQLPANHVVQVQLQGGQCTMLDRYGNVIRNFGSGAAGVVSLKDTEN